MGTNHDTGRAKQRAARARAKTEGIKYTEALRQVESAQTTVGRFGPRTSDVEAYLASLADLRPGKWYTARTRYNGQWRIRYMDAVGLNVAPWILYTPGFRNMEELALKGAPWFQHVPGYGDLKDACLAVEDAVASAWASERWEWWIAGHAAEAIVLMDLLTPEQYHLVTDPMRDAGATLPKHPGAVSNDIVAWPSEVPEYDGEPFDISLPSQAPVHTYPVSDRMMKYRGRNYAAVSGFWQNKWAREFSVIKGRPLEVVSVDQDRRVMLLAPVKPDDDLSHS